MQFETQILLYEEVVKMKSGYIMKIYARDKTPYYLTCYRSKYNPNIIMIRVTEYLKKACILNECDTVNPILQPLFSEYVCEIISVNTIDKALYLPLRFITTRDNERYVTVINELE